MSRSSQPAPSTPSDLVKSHLDESRAVGRDVDIYDALLHVYCLLKDAGDPDPATTLYDRYPKYREKLKALIDVEDTYVRLDEMSGMSGRGWPRIGEDFLDCEILGQLGKGAFARVYLAMQPELGKRYVALKVSRQHGEARTLGKLDHPNIMPIHWVHPSRQEQEDTQDKQPPQNASVEQRENPVASAPSGQPAAKDERSESVSWGDGQPAGDGPAGVDQRPVEATRVESMAADATAIEATAIEAEVKSVIDELVSPKSVGPRLTTICMPFQGCATLHNVLKAAFDTAHPHADAQVILDVAKNHSYIEESGEQLEPDEELKTGSYATGVLHLIAQLADALDYTHNKNVLHRDLKPSNVLLTTSGRPKLLDFNLSSDEAETFKLQGGTLSYMAPEQIRTVFDCNDGKDEVDQRSDIYSLGVMLYQMLSGRLPFESASDPDDAVLADLETGQVRNPDTARDGEQPAAPKQLAPGQPTEQPVPQNDPLELPELSDLQNSLQRDKDLMNLAMRAQQQAALMDAMQLWHAQEVHELTPLEQLNPQVKRATSDLVARCLAFEPENRPQTAAELRDDLRRIYRKPKSRIVSRALGTVAVAIIATLALALSLRDRPLTFEQYEAQAYELMGKGEYDAALTTLADAWSVSLTDDERARIIRPRAECNRRMGNWMAVADDLNASAEDDEVAVEWLAYAEFRMKRFGQALPTYKSLPNWKRNPRILTNAGYCYLNMGNQRYRFAKSMFESALVLDPECGLAILGGAMLQRPTSEGQWRAKLKDLHAAWDRDVSVASLHRAAAEASAILDDPWLLLHLHESVALGIPHTSIVEEPLFRYVLGLPCVETSLSAETDNPYVSASPAVYPPISPLVESTGAPSASGPITLE